MQSDGRIRSKDIGTGEVNSRIVSDLYSDTYDGDRVDPEAQPGTSGWILLKNGLAVFNQAIIRGTITAAEIIGAIIHGGEIRGGEVNIREGGRLTVGGDLTADPAVAPIVTIDEGGVRVGPNVDLNESGLQVIGGFVSPIDVFAGVNFATNAALSTTDQTVVSVTVTPPSWAQTMKLMSWLKCQITDSNKNVRTRFMVGAQTATASAEQSVEGTVAFTNVERVHEGSAGVSLPNNFTLNGRASLNTGTNSVNVFTLHVLAIFGRSG